jgi:hypothetical protein
MLHRLPDKYGPLVPVLRELILCPDILLGADGNKACRAAQQGHRAVRGECRARLAPAALDALSIERAGPCPPFGSCLRLA